MARYRLMENEKANILWDTSIQTDRMIRGRQTDIVLKGKELNQTWLIDILIPGERRVEDKEREKMEKYEALARELRKIGRGLLQLSLSW